MYVYIYTYIEYVNMNIYTYMYIHLYMQWHHHSVVINGIYMLTTRTEWVFSISYVSPSLS